MELSVGNIAPVFKGVTQDGTLFDLTPTMGRGVILYFYPKDNTAGCTLEAQSLRDGREELGRLGYDIVGVSPDSVASHERFCSKHNLGFRLVADTDHSIAELYGVWGEKMMYGRKVMGIKRTTFVIAPDGRIEQIFRKVDTKNHWAQIVEWHKTKQQ